MFVVKNNIICLGLKYKNFFRYLIFLLYTYIGWYYSYCFVIVLFNISLWILYFFSLLYIYIIVRNVYVLF